MANQQHLAVVRAGSDAILEFREANPRVVFDLAGADLTRLYLREARLQHAILDDADLRLTDLTNALLIGASLRHAKLSYGNLASAKLLSANLSEAELVQTDLFGTNLSGAKLVNADLSSAFLVKANLARAEVDGAKITNACCGNTIFAHVDLSGVHGLDSVKHKFPSTVGIDTLYLSKGQIHQAFLQGCGVPEEIIALQNTIAGKKVGYYSCFISFTDADDEFSERLYDDLWHEGVRCWRWKEDARWGCNLMSEVDGAIQTNDKLIVICSRASLNAPAVLREIERALQKEDRLGRGGTPQGVLFPIRLDDYVFDGWEHSRKADVVAKHVGDFRNWSDSIVYDKALGRLIQDLRSESAS